MSLNLQGLLAVGSAHESVNIFGNSSLITPATVTTLPGGLLAVATNSGVQSHDEFTFIPTFEARLGFQVTHHLRAFVGYSFLYWFDVARPGDQIDRTVNPVLVPANLAFGSAPAVPARPFESVHKTDFWAQGVDFGMEFRY
jgi:hypothetical protein